MKNVLIILGHPNEDSHAEMIRAQYKDGAEKAGAIVKEIIIRDLDFDPLLLKGYSRSAKMEEDIMHSTDLITWADHLVFIYPNWWGTYPALFKAFLDKVLWPGFAFNFKKGYMKWEKLLTGRTARIFVTMANPVWHYHLITKSPGHKAMRYSTLHYCGIRPVRFTTFGMTNKVSDQKLKLWLKKVYRLGKKLR